MRNLNACRPWQSAAQFFFFFSNFTWHLYTALHKRAFIQTKLSIYTIGHSDSVSHLKKKKRLHLYKTLTACIYTRTALAFIQMGSSDSMSHFFPLFFFKEKGCISTKPAGICTRTALAFIQLGSSDSVSEYLFHLSLMLW